MKKNGECQYSRDVLNPPMFPGGMEIGKEEENAVLGVLKSKRLFRYYGPGDCSSKVAEFERRFASYMDAKYALGVNSGTSALICGLIAVGVGPGDEVIVPAYTFIATASAVLAVNAIPVIVDVDDTLTLDPEAFEKAITQRTKAVIPVHMRGISCQMDEILRIARRHNIRVIEDCAQAIGGSYKGKKLGAIGDVGCFSLQFHKIITTGEGGVLVTNDGKLLKRATMYHDTGGLWRPKQWKDIGKTYMPIPGVNYRMNELAGAIGLVQLERLDNLLLKMRRQKKKIKDTLRQIKGIQLRRIPDEDGDAGVCVMFFLPDKVLAKKFAKAMQSEGIDAATLGSLPDWHIFLYWKHILKKKTPYKIGCPFTCPYYKGTVSYSNKMCRKSLELLSRIVHLSVSPLLSNWAVEQINGKIQNVAKSLL